MARHALTVTVPFACDFDRTSRDLGRQLAQALRLAIRQGGLRSGDPLPSSRTLSKALGVSRGTVVEAFAQLVAEGFLESRQGASTWVTRTTPDESPRAVTTRTTLPARRRALPDSVAKFTRVAEQFVPLPGVPFAISVPAGATAPGEAWRRLGNRLRARGPAEIGRAHV